MGLVLRQDDNLEVSGIHDVRQREIDETEVTTERDGRLCAVLRQGHQSLPSPPARTIARTWFFAMWHLFVGRVDPHRRGSVGVVTLYYKCLSIATPSRFDFDPRDFGYYVLHASPLSEGPHHAR